MTTHLGRVFYVYKLEQSELFLQSMYCIGSVELGFISLTKHS